MRISPTPSIVVILSWLPDEEPSNFIQAWASPALWPAATLAELYTSSISSWDLWPSTMTAWKWAWTILFGVRLMVLAWSWASRTGSYKSIRPGTLSVRTPSRPAWQHQYSGDCWRPSDSCPYEQASAAGRRWLFAATVAAKFNAYITPGSVRVGNTTKADAVANLQVKNTDSNKMTITHYWSLLALPRWIRFFYLFRRCPITSREFRVSSWQIIGEG